MKRLPAILASVLLIPVPNAAIEVKSLPKPIASEKIENLLQKGWGLEQIQTAESWQISRGSKKVVVAIIDTGIDLNHPDLKDNIWKNEKEIPNNGMDDDGNGFVDDFHGWNFVSSDHDLSDNHGHGTHIAGIIGANGKRVTGVAPEVSLMILKYYDPKVPGSDTVGKAIAAMDYAVKMGADIINFSAGGPYFSKEEEAVLRKANEKGVLVVAAAGNEKNNSDVISFYPADYALPNILSVTAIDFDRRILATSNYGVRTVDIAAPGRDIYSTLPEGRYGRLSGTSQATAFATGVAALLMSDKTRTWTPETLIDHMVRTGEPDQELLGKTRGRTRLNSYRALAIRGTDTTVTEEFDNLTSIRLTMKHNPPANFDLDDF